MNEYRRRILQKQIINQAIELHGLTGCPREIMLPLNDISFNLTLKFDRQEQNTASRVARSKMETTTATKGW